MFETIVHVNKLNERCCMKLQGEMTIYDCESHEEFYEYVLCISLLKSIKLDIAFILFESDSTYAMLCMYATLKMHDATVFLFSLLIN